MDSPTNVSRQIIQQSCRSISIFAVLVFCEATKIKVHSGFKFLNMFVFDKSSQASWLCGH